MSTRREWSVKKNNFDKTGNGESGYLGNFEIHFCLFVESVGGPEQGFRRCFPDV